MSLDKAIEHGKENRRPYFTVGKYDPTCRPNGGCPYCKNNRLHKKKKREQACKDQLKEYSSLEDQPTSEQTKP